MSPVIGVPASEAPSSWTGAPAGGDDSRDGLAHVAGAEDGDVCHVNSLIKI